MNPFLVPEMEDDPTRPLCPWDVPEHANYYVDVDHTPSSFLKFQQLASPAESPFRRGRVVLVGGQGGCGKSSLINRCVHWLLGELSQPGCPVTRAEVIDLTNVSGEDQTVNQRMNQASVQLVDELKDKKLIVEPEVLAELRACSDQPNVLYPRLGRAIHDQLAVIVLLPPINLTVSTIELLKEIVDYARLVQRRLLLFIEVTLAEDGPGQLADIRASSSAPPIVTLPVAPLGGDDGPMFGVRRFEMHKDKGPFPKMTPEDLRRIIEGPPRSVKFMQKLLYNVYEERRLSNVRYSEDDWVTFEDIAKYVYQRSTGEGIQFS